MKKKVLVVSLDQNNGSNRGIYQYSKALIKAISNQYSTGLLTQALKSEEMEIIESLSNYHHYFYKKYKRKNRYSYYLNKFLKIKSDQKIVINSNKYAVDKYSNEIEFFVNDPAIYYYHNLCLIRGMKSCVQDIRLDGLNNRDVIITTSPLNVKSKNKKIIQTLHDVFPLLDDVYFQHDFDKKIYGLNYADRIMAMSKYAKTSFLKYYPKLENKIDVVYQAIAIDENLIEKSKDIYLNEMILNKYCLEPKAYMFFVGAIEYRKNIHNLVQAYKIAMKGNDGLKLVIAGRADDPKYLNEFGLLHYMQEDNAENIQFIGEISNLEKICLIKNSRAFLFPSLLEGFGIPVVEAQTLGVPVLTSNNSALTEVAGDSAFLVENPEDLEELADGIRQLWNDDELCGNLCNKGFENIKRFAFDTFSDNVNRIIDSV